MNICMIFVMMMQVLVLYQIAYIAWVWVVEGRFRPTLASLFMYSSRGLLGYSTQLPVPQVFRSPPSLAEMHSIEPWFGVSIAECPISLELSPLHHEELWFIGFASIQNASGVSTEPY